MTPVSPALVEHPQEAIQTPWKGRQCGRDAYFLARSHRHRTATKACDARKIASKKNECVHLASWRRAIKLLGEITINIGNISSAESILASNENLYLNRYEVMLRDRNILKDCTSMQISAIRKRLGYRALETVSPRFNRMQAEQVLKFGCDTKYAAWTFGGIGVRTYGPVCFVFDINKLPPELLETATAFIGDSGRKSVVNGVACLPSDILSDFIDFQSLATEASCRFYLDYQTAGSQLSTVHIQSLRDRYSNTDAMLEVHLHGKLPLSALCSIRVCKTEYDKAKRMEETAEELYSSPDQELNRVLYKSYMNSYKSIRKIIDRKYTGNIKLVLA